MKNTKAKGSPPRAWQTLTWLVRALPLLAMALSAYLTWVALSGSATYGCGSEASGFSCDHVLSSAWGRWLGIPVAPFGLLVYSALAGLCWMIGSDSPLIPPGLRSVFVALVTLAAGSAIWFVSLQWLAIGHWCPYCLAIHASGVGIGLFVTIDRWGKIDELPRPVQPRVVGLPPPPPPKQHFSKGVAVLAGIIPLAILVIGQLAFPSQTYDDLDVQQTSSSVGISDLGGLGATSVVADRALAEHESDADQNTTVEESKVAADDHPAHQLADMAASPTHGATAPTTTVASAPTDHTSLDDLLTLDEPRVEDDLLAFDAVATASNPTSQPVTTVDAAATAEDSNPTSPIDSSVKADASPVGGGRLLKFFDGQVIVNTSIHPMLGPPNAEHIVVEMVDYTCNSCRQLHGMARRAKATWGDQLAFVIFPCPLAAECNKAVQKTNPAHRDACGIARLALAVWLIRPQSFPQYHDWLMETETARTEAEALDMACRYVDRELLLRTAAGSGVQKMLSEYTSLYTAMKRVKNNLSLPIQFVGNRPVAGLPSETDMLRIWKEFITK